MWNLLDTVRDILGGCDTPSELLCEIHEHYALQKEMSKHKLWVYDFALPMLCLQVWCCNSMFGTLLALQCLSQSFGFEPLRC